MKIEGKPIMSLNKPVTKKSDKFSNYEKNENPFS
jgi:hypothetical protein